MQRVSNSSTAQLSERAPPNFSGSALRSRQLPERLAKGDRLGQQQAQQAIATPSKKLGQREYAERESHAALLKDLIL